MTDEPVVASTVAVKGAYEGKVYGLSCLISAGEDSLDLGLLQEARRLLIERLGDELGVSRADQDEDWYGRFTLHVRPLSQAALDAYLGKGS